MRVATAMAAALRRCYAADAATSGPKAVLRGILEAAPGPMTAESVWGAAQVRWEERREEERGGGGVPTSRPMAAALHALATRTVATHQPNYPHAHTPQSSGLKSKRFTKEMLVQMRRAGALRTVPRVDGKSYGYTLAEVKDGE